MATKKTKKSKKPTEKVKQVKKVKTVKTVKTVPPIQAEEVKAVSEQNTSTTEELQDICDSLNKSLFDHKEKPIDYNYEKILEFLRVNEPLEPLNTKAGITKLRATLCTIIAQHENPYVKDNDLYEIARTYMVHSTNDALVDKLLAMWEEVHRELVMFRADNPKRLLHIEVGSNGWEPTELEIQAAEGQFRKAMQDPRYVVVATRAGIKASVVA